MKTIGIYKIVPEAYIPVKSTTNSACFDIRCCFYKCNIAVYNLLEKQIADISSSNPKKLILEPGQRAIVPTGIKLLIPHGYVVKCYPRSGLAIKCGVSLINGVGVIDSDYIDELNILVHNTNMFNSITLVNGERIMQIELQKVEDVGMVKCDLDDLKIHAEKSNRQGGLGSTGME